MEQDTSKIFTLPPNCRFNCAKTRSKPIFSMQPIFKCVGICDVALSTEQSSFQYYFLFELMLYITVNNFSVMMGCFFLGEPVLSNEGKMTQHSAYSETRI